MFLLIPSIADLGGGALGLDLALVEDVLSFERLLHAGTFVEKDEPKSP